MAAGPCGIPPFEVRVDGSVCSSYQHPARFGSPRSRGDDGFEIVSRVEYLRSRHEGGLLCRKVGCEILMELRRVEISETICRFLYRSRLAKVAWETLSVVRLILASVWHVGGDINQSDDRWIRSGFGNYRSTVTMSDKNTRSILLSEDSLCGSHIFFKGRLRLLDDADVETIFHKKGLDAFPARSVCPSAVDQNNIPDPIVLVLCWEQAAWEQQ